MLLAVRTTVSSARVAHISAYIVTGQLPSRRTDRKVGTSYLLTLHGDPRIRVYIWLAWPVHQRALYWQRINNTYAYALRCLSRARLCVCVNLPCVHVIFAYYVIRRMVHGRLVADCSKWCCVKFLLFFFFWFMDSFLFFFLFFFLGNQVWKPVKNLANFWLDIGEILIEISSHFKRTKINEKYKVYYRLPVFEKTKYENSSNILPLLSNSFFFSKFYQFPNW